MGYYHIELVPDAKKLCTFVLPFGKYEYQQLPMGLCNSPDIFPEKMSELMCGLEFVWAYIDDLLALTNGTFSDHLEKLELIFKQLRQAGLKVNADKSFFAKYELEYLGYWITREGIQPVTKKIEAIQNIAPPLKPTRTEKVHRYCELISRHVDQTITCISTISYSHFQIHQVAMG
jgi:hypothetical protein